MGLKVILTPRAIEDLRVIVQFIARDNAERACSFGDELLDKALQVGDFPLAGRLVLEVADANVREVFLGHYRIIYEIFPDRECIYVLRFWHAARGRPEVCD